MVSDFMPGCAIYLNLQILHLVFRGLIAAESHSDDIQYIRCFFADKVEVIYIEHSNQNR